jgi:alanine racemase
VFSIAEILEITQGQALRLDNPDALIQHLLIDSRKVAFPQTSLFFAIKGEHHDGHQFLEELYFKGIRDFIVERKDLEAIPQQLTENQSFRVNILTHSFFQINIILVENSVLALQKIAAAHRQKFNYPVIGITGSNGKTIVKEWLYQLLSPDFRIIKSPKSYNSQVGVPLSVWEMHESHQLAIFEAGISQPNEMANLEKVIQPTIGVFTNIGSAHDEGFENRSQKIAEKLKLFAHTHLVFSVNQTLQEQSPIELTQNFTLISSSQNSDNQSTTLDIKIENHIYQFLVPFVDVASLENILTCLAVLLYFKIPPIEIQPRLLRLKPISMRLELKQGINNCYVIDDSYNNDLAGLNIALNFMALQKQKGRRVLILSDMLETHLPDNQLYKTIAELISGKNLIDELIGIGEKLYTYQHFFSLELQNQEVKFRTGFFDSTQAFLQSTTAQSISNAIILIKGARKFQFEKIVQALQHKTHGTVLEINMDALVHNLNFYRSLLKPQTKLMAMVKAFAYGSGSAEVANLLQYHRVDYLGVAYADEGIFLRQNGVHLPIMVMNPSGDTFQQLIDYQLEPEIYSFKILNEFLDFCQEIQKNDFKIHLKIDTGMRRLGFELTEIEQLIDVLEKRLPWAAQVASIMSHLAGADDEKHLEFSYQQIANFKLCAQKIEDVLGYYTIKHILNSPGITRFPDAQLDMVRLGIGLYGVDANRFYQNHLKPVTTLKTTISQIKIIQAGDTVSYGRTFKAEKRMQIATLAIGYADGFSRRLSNGRGKVLIKNKLVPIIGRVCMDMCMVDITDIAAQVGDEVVIFGENPSIFDLAEAMETIPYEVLTMVSERVKRVFYTE